MSFKAETMLPTGLLLALTLGGCATRGFPPEHQIVNWDQVDGKVSRGAQPNAAALRWLATNSPGCTVVNLRNDPWGQEARECEALGLRYVPLPWSGGMAPSWLEVETALNIISRAPAGVFIHCQFGCDRTGTLVACYRIRQGESQQDAYNDAKLHGLSSVFLGAKSRITSFY